MSATSAVSLPDPERRAVARADDRDARLSELVRDQYAFVWRILRRFGLSPTDADDGAQQVFLVVSRRLADVDLGSERAFLFRTAMHVASKVHRTRRRRPEDAGDLCDQNESGAPSTDELIDQRRARELLDRVLDEMDVDLKAVIVLFEIEGLTMSEIADALDVPSGTVASRLRRARADLEARVLRHQAKTGAGGLRS